MGGSITPLPKTTSVDNVTIDTNANGEIQIVGSAQGTIITPKDIGVFTDKDCLQTTIPANQLQIGSVISGFMVIYKDFGSTTPSFVNFTPQLDLTSATTHSTTDYGNNSYHLVWFEYTVIENGANLDLSGQITTWWTRGASNPSPRFTQQTIANIDVTKEQDFFINIARNTSTAVDDIEIRQGYLTLIR